MAIKIEFLPGEVEKKTSSLYQWDYGQTLEIESLDLPALIEVHFACPDMKEAIVRVCSVTNGVTTVAIPNRCLEQANTITAWVYEINGNTGHTTKTIQIPVIARMRPGRSEEIPQDVSDKYTELIAEVNEVVGSVASGELMVGRAAQATHADRATQADNASSAAHAESASFATGASVATSATNAINDTLGNRIDTTYVSFKDEFTRCEAGSMLLGGSYQFRVHVGGAKCYTILDIDSGTNVAMLGTTGAGTDYVLSIQNGVPSVLSYTRGSNTYTDITNDAPVYYRKIH